MKAGRDEPIKGAAAQPSESRIDVVLKRFEAALKTRRQWETTWQDCYDYAIPKRAGFNETTEGIDRTTQIYDSTAVIAVPEFSSRLQAGLMPPFARWYDFQAGSEIGKDERKDVNEALEELAGYVWEVLGNTNLDAEVHESFTDLAVGTGALIVEDDPEQLIRFTSISATELVVDTGPYGKADAKYRIRKMRLRDIMTVWPEATIPEEMKRKANQEPETRFRIIESVTRDWSARDTEKSDFVVFCTEPKQILHESKLTGVGSDPWIVFRWSKAAGETYGRGPLYNTLADIRTLNLVIQLVLENAEMAVTGLWQADDDGVINTDTIQMVPGTIIPKAVNSQGLQPLETPGRFDVAQMILDDLRHNVKKGLYNEQLGQPEKTPMSATEVYERMADLARNIGSAYGRLHNELVTPLLQRVVYILKKQGRIEIPQIDGREVKIVNLSPLAQAQHQENVARMGRFLELLNGGFGPQMTNVICKAEEAGAYIAREVGVPENLLRTDVERKQLVEQLQQMAAQAEQPPA